MSVIKYIFIFILLGFLSCQEEQNMELPVENTEDIVTNDIAELLMKVVVNDQEVVIEVDSMKCLIVELPRPICFNDSMNTTRLVTVEEEYFNIVDSVGRNGFEWKYPVRVMKPGDPFSSFVFDREELDGFEMQLCGERTVTSNNIACVDFLYPVKFKMFNTNTSTFKTIAVESDEEVVRLISEKSSDEKMSIEYPISLINLNTNTTIEVNHNQELLSELASANNSCLEN